LLIAVLTFYCSLLTRTWNYVDISSLPPPDLFYGFSVKTEITGFDQSAGKISVKIDMTLPQNMINFSDSTLNAEILQIRPFISQQANFTLALLDFPPPTPCYYGSQTIVFETESHRDLYPFDYHTFRFMLAFPTEISKQPSVSVIRLSDEFSGIWFIRGVRIDWSGNQWLYVDYVLWRPYSYQVQNLIPIWFVFLTLFVTAKIDSFRGINMLQLKMSIYMGLLIFILGFSTIVLPFVAQVSEGLRISLMTTIALSIVVDIVILSRRNGARTNNKSKKKDMEGLRLIRGLVSLRDLPFIVAVLLLSFFACTSTGRYGDSPVSFNLGPVYLYCFLAPIILAFVCLYFLKRKIWMIIGLLCLSLSLAILLQSWGLFTISRMV
jgi:hypothetical protein